MSYVAGGCSTYSKKEFIHLPHYPKSIVYADGALVVADKREFVDFTASLGAIILGYEAIEAVDLCVPLLHESEERAAETLCKATGWEQVRWCKNGSDATEAAVRLARYVTGRRFVLCNSYHGSHSDLVTATPNKNGGVLRSTASFLVTCPDVEALFEDIGLYNPAAVIIEPVTWNQPEWWLAALKKACFNADCLLIFDEMITGFRNRPGSIAPDVRPDLACYGKAIGNGAAIACVAGNQEYMHHFESNVFMSGTYACEVGSLERCHETVSYLASENGRQDYERMAGQYQQLSVALEGIARGYVGRLHLELPTTELHERFVDGLAKRGILVGRDFFQMLAHADGDIAKAVQAIKETRAEVGV